MIKGYAAFIYLHTHYSLAVNSESEGKPDMPNETNIPVIRQGVKSILNLNSDDRIRAMAWEREKAERDYYSEIGNARSQGREEGRAEGRAEGRKEEQAAIIAKMRAEGIPEEIIKRITGNN